MENKKLAVSDETLQGYCNMDAVERLDVLDVLLADFDATVGFEMKDTDISTDGFVAFYPTNDTLSEWDPWHEEAFSFDIWKPNISAVIYDLQDALRNSAEIVTPEVYAIANESIRDQNPQMPDHDGLLEEGRFLQDYKLDLADNLNALSVQIRHREKELDNSLER